MSHFIIPVIDEFGNKVYFQTSDHKGQESVDGYSSVVMWLQKNGFKIATNVPETPQQPKIQEKYCPICAKLMTYKEGVSKSGKAWKGYFCPDNEHAPIWVK